MAAYIFVATLCLCALVFGVFALFERKKLYDNKVVSGMSGVLVWRKRLNAVTDGFVALGNDALMRGAASQTADPSLSAFKGQTLKFYQGFKQPYLALSFAYNGSAAAVQNAERLLAGSGLMKVRGAHSASQLSELAVELKEVPVGNFTRLLALPRLAPTPPSYKIEYLFDVCERLTNEIKQGLATIRATPAQVQARLVKVDEKLAQSAQVHDALTAGGATYTPYEERLAAISALRAQILGDLQADPLGALNQCANLDKAAEVLVAELRQAQQLLSSLSEGSQKLATTREWVSRVRSTPVTCPWIDTRGDDLCWQLDTPDSDPEGQLNQCETLLAQARQDLASGALQTVAGGIKQAGAAISQANTMVKAMFDAKTAVDEQVPKVRVELAAVRAELHAITGGVNTQEMANLVERTCEAVDARVNEVYALYRRQLFPAALTLLTGSNSNEYGLPVAKLLAQSKELLRLLKQAAQVAGTLTQASA
jgi:hypothetical protein